jgi:hypothetical protein
VKYLLVLLLASPALADQIGSTTKRENILFQYLFNEPSGTTWIDNSTHSLVAVLGGTGQAIISGKHGNAISFNGSGGLALPDMDGTADNVVGNFTIIASYRPKGGATGTSCIVCKNDDIGNTVIFGFRGHRPYMNWSLASGGDISGVMEYNVMLSSNVWHHLIWSRKAGEVKDMWVDGVRVASTVTTSSSYTTTAGQNGGFEIGTNSAGANNNVIGDLDEITYWRVYLSDGEKRNQYAQWFGRKRQFSQ